MKAAVACAVLLFGGARAADDPTATCALFQPAAVSATSASCLACHADRGQPGNHPVDVDYARSAASGLRPADEVVRRGILLPEGQIRCVTCHDARSPWKSKLALPPGSKAMPAVNPFDRSTYDGRPRRPLMPGDAVSTRPLCLGCHAMD